MCHGRPTEHPAIARHRHVLLSVVPLLLITTIGSSSARAQTPDSTAADQPDSFAPNVLPSLSVERAPGPIEVDGEFDDAGWVGAVRATNFSEHFPDEATKPPVESEVWITYDDDNFYLAFFAYDDPRSIRASLRDRDEMWSDDYFGILLDTYGDASWAYFLFANPLGVQGDTRFSTNAGEDASFDIIYDAEAKITDEGYQIEMAIPFKSLRFPNRDVQTWRATFWRTWPRESRAQHTWASIDRDDPCLLCQFGTLTGMQGVKPGGALEVMPAVVASQTGQLEEPGDPNSEFKNQDPDGEISLFVRYPFASGLTTEAAINPDFSQVESDVAQIDVNTTFALFFPERRPFFQEGADLFSTNFDVVYTRQINDPLLAGKLIGRMGRTTLAYLTAFDENSPIMLPFQERSYVGMAGKSFSNIGRFQQTFWRDSFVGAILTDRRFEDNAGSGTTGGVDGRFRFLGNYSIEYQALASYTREPDDTTLTTGINDMTFASGEHTAGRVDGLNSESGGLSGLLAQHLEPAPDLREDQELVVNAPLGVLAQLCARPSRSSSVRSSTWAMISGSAASGIRRPSTSSRICWRIPQARLPTTAARFHMASVTVSPNPSRKRVFDFSPVCGSCRFVVGNVRMHVSLAADVQRLFDGFEQTVAFVAHMCGVQRVSRSGNAGKPGYLLGFAPAARPVDESGGETAGALFERK